MDNMNNQQQNHETSNFQQQNLENLNYNNQNGFNSQYGSQMCTYNQMDYNNQMQMGIQNQQNNKTATILCIISLICCYGPYLLELLFSYVFVGIAGDIEVINNAFTIIVGILQVLTIIGVIASIVLIVIVRVKYPTNTFGKILMWIYIVQFVVFLITTVVTIIACGIAFDYFFRGLSGCGSIG